MSEITTATIIEERGADSLDAALAESYDELEIDEPAAPAEPARRPDREAPAAEAAEPEGAEEEDAAADLEALLSREMDAQDGTAEAAHGRKLAEELDTMFAPLGIEKQHHPEAVRRLVAAEAAIRQNPVQAVSSMIASAGMVGTPRAAEFIRQLAAATGVPLSRDERLEAIEQRQAGRDVEGRQRQFQALHAIASADVKISSFATAKDTTGQPLHPHFDAVRGTVGALMMAAVRSGRELSLDQAYEAACWSVPEFRAPRQKAEADRHALERSRQRAEAVAKAKGARTPRTASVPVVDAAPDDLEQLLNDEYDRMVA